MSQESPSYANLANVKYIESLYEQWSTDPQSVESSWRQFFDGMQFASLLSQALPPREESLDFRVALLIRAYRTYGHLFARINPLEDAALPLPRELDPSLYGLAKGDQERVVPTCGFLKEKTAPLKLLIEGLQATYCKGTGFEYMDLGSLPIEEWIQKEVEPYFPTHLSSADKREILTQLSEAEGFETFLHTKYVGQKRFSLEGAETLIPLMKRILEEGASNGVEQVFIGMAHRGRLNVLANVMGKSYAYLFQEFEDTYTPDLSESSGDVKYHMGFQGTYASKTGKELSLTLSANPSHLESVDPVVIGGTRSAQERLGKGGANRVLPIQIHGDASIAGQGVVFETLNLSQLHGYGTGGAIHIVINNQIGFTTLPKEGRSTRYCTDIAKTFGAPVFHVNAEDPEGCIAVAKLALLLRQRFGCDVFIDLIGYRKYGHNEGDEPAFTQPLEYQMIRSRKSIREIYSQRLVSEGILSQEEARSIEETFKAKLGEILKTVKSEATEAKAIRLRMRGRDLAPLFAKVETAISEERIRKLTEMLSTAPSNFNTHPKVLRLLKERVEMLDAGVDWGLAENLAYASLSTEGVHIRLSGQDVCRGTFSHRHGVLVDQVTAAQHFLLSSLGEGQAPCDLFNSPLSEYAVLGFEFGYSLNYPKSLVLWEAQYGDFANGAQIIIDQWFTSAEIKWGHATNLTLLLPHGYEGGGPEHSSARIERFLQLCAEENMIVANCTTPAQLFHLLRRQGLRSMKKPLVVFTPKALLRHPLCKSQMKEFCKGSFEEILDDPTPPASPRRILFTSGKIYYDLIQEREKRGALDVILRIEQLYPFKEEKVGRLLQKYKGVTEAVFVQEEHENMGAYPFLRPLLSPLLGEALPLSYVGRAPGASTAAGSLALHKLQHLDLLQKLYPEGRK